MVLEVAGLDAWYNGMRVVRGLSFSVAAGDVMVMLGPNGAGKTTTLMTICGLLRPIRGSLALSGASIGRRSQHQLARRGVSFLAEDRMLLRSLTVAENLRLVRDRARDPLEIFPELEPLLSRRAGVLSGGEQQMLGLARALAVRPKLLVIDELSLGLAPMIVDRLLHVVRDAATSTGTAVLLVEQQVQKALAIADSGIVLVHGEVALRGPAAELRDRQDLLRASYLGSLSTESSADRKAIP